MSFPAPPWRMHGQMWLSLFRVPQGGPDGRPPGVYGVGLVDYQEGSPLTYGELLVARQVTVPRSDPHPGKHVTVTDIWVDSVPSREGGRALWAVPKDLADFTWATVGSGRMPATEAVVATAQGRIAEVSFHRPRILLPRVPFSGSTWQRREDGSSVAASLTGSARSFPCRGIWEFDPDGPLAWLAGLRPVASFAMHDFRMTFG